MNEIAIKRGAELATTVVMSECSDAREGLLALLVAAVSLYGSTAHKRTEMADSVLIEAFKTLAGSVADTTLQQSLDFYRSKK